MKWIRNKLRSQGGASLMAALLFFLLCVMVGASVLAASASNAGKTRERRRDQQEYFTVSSALQLVCDRLTKAEYKAYAKVTERIVTITPSPTPAPTATTDPTATPTPDPAATPTPDPSATTAPPDSESYTYKVRTYEQKSGKFKLDNDDSSGGLNEKWDGILPLRKELDYLFSERFTEAECNAYHGKGEFQGDDVHLHPSTFKDMSTPVPDGHTLTIKVDTTGEPDDVLEELTKKVEVKIRLGKENALGDEKYWLFLEAKLIDGKGKFVVKAELKPEDSLPLPHINDYNTYNGEYPDLSASPDPSTGFYPSIARTDDGHALKWELVRIYKEASEASED